MLPSRSIVRQITQIRHYRPDRVSPPAIKRPHVAGTPWNYDTTLGEVYDAIWTRWPYRKALLLIPFAYVMHTLTNTPRVSEEEKAVLRRRDAKLKSLEFHQD